MSIETWAEEFMPITVLPEGADDRFCLEHGLKKWSGALPENCAKHNVKYKHHRIIDSSGESYKFIEFDDTTCLLCRKQYKKNSDYECAGCIFVEMWEKTCHWNKGTDYNVWMDALNDPQPMIDLIKNTLVQL